jgi:hypothetical protein
MYARALYSTLVLASISIVFGFASIASAQVCTCVGTGTAKACNVVQTLADGTTQRGGTCSADQEGQTIQSGLLRDGVFGCNASKYANPGTLAAVGGVYVPVNDAAVTINTGYLVYKECVLDGVTQKISEAARTELTGTITRAINTRRGGLPLYPQNRRQEDIERTVAVAVARLQDPAFTEVISPAFRREAIQSSARHIVRATQKSQDFYASTFEGSPEEHLAYIQAELKTFDWDKFFSLSRGPCNHPSAAAECLNTSINTVASAVSNDINQELLEGRGFYAVTDDNPDPLARKILTPAALVAEGATQVVTAGFRCLEGADEISEVCAPLFSGLTTQLINDSRGLQGITQAVGGIASYVSRMVSEASNAVRQEAVNAALSILSVARQTEALFKQAKDASAQIITNAITRLRNAERTCWELIVTNVCQNPPDRNRRCMSKPVCTTDPATGQQTCSTPFELQVATSTQFSQEVIDVRIAPLGVQIANDIRASEQALLQLDQLIASVTGSASATNQRQALERLDTLVAQGLLHTTNDVQAARSQTESVTSALTELVEATLQAWGDNTDPAIGWCNVNNPSAIQRWVNAWRR